MRQLTEEELKKVRVYYHSLLAQEQVLKSDATRARVIHGPTFVVFADELERINSDFPGLLPPFTAEEFYSHFGKKHPMYDASAVLSFLGAAIARLKILIEGAESTPVTQARDFSFVADTELRKVLQRDYAEVQRAYIAGCWKAVIVLSGALLEAMLLIRAQQDPRRARLSVKAPRQPEITRWSLANLVAVCVELGFVTPSVEKLSGSVYEYHNLVYPGSEIRHKLAFDAEEAKFALEVVNIVYQDISQMSPVAATSSTESESTSATP